MLKEIVKKKIIASIVVLIFLFIIPIFSYYTILDYMNYFNYTDSIIYSRFDTVIILSPLITVPFSILGIYVIFSGEQAPYWIQKKINTFIICTFIFIFILTIASSVFYTNHLEKKGYYKCTNVPSGWMPGMATKYTIDISTCNKS